MSLQVWLPLAGDLHNQGLNGDLEFSAINTLTFNNDGKIGKSYQRATNNTQVTTGININSNLLDLLGTEASVAVWIKPLGTHTHYNGTLLSSGNWNAKRWAFGVSQDNTKVDVLCGGYNTYIDCTVPVNQWTHLCSTFDNGISKLYKNGVYVGQLTGRANFDSDASNTCIGRETYASGYFGFNGLINDFRIYDHALSDKEVEEIAKGLVLHYKLDDAYIENSTILSCSITETAYNAPISKYGYNDDSNLIKTIGTFQGKDCVKIGTRIAGQQARPYAYFGNLFTSDGTNAPAYKALSFDYFTTVPTTTWLNIYKLGSGEGTATWKTTNSDGIHSGTYTNSSNSIIVKPNEWNHIEVVFHGTTAANAEWGYCINGPNHTSSTDFYFLYANIQLEENDHVTGYGKNMHANIVQDTSGYNNNGTIAGTLMVSKNTPKYKYSTIFDGNTAAIQTPNLKTIITDKIYTISCWTYKTQIGSKNYQTIYGGPSGFELEARSGSATNPLFRIHNWGGGTTLYEFGQWYHFCFVHTNDNSKLYINGELKITGTSANIPSGNYFIGAWNTSSQQNYDGNISDFRIYATALTDEQILDLYHTSASIDKEGNVYARELVEK